MADFDLEQLKTIIESLGERLEKTKGDQLSRDELYRIRMVLTKMSNTIGKGEGLPNNDRGTIISELVKEMRKAAPKGGPVQSPTDRRGTIIAEERAARRGNSGGNTILDQILKNAGKEANEFSTSLDHAGKSTKTFSDRMKDNSAAIGAATAGAAKIVGQMAGAGAERIDLYRQLLASGEGTVMSMQDMGRQASAAGMTVKDFVNAMTNGTQGARQLGAIKFGDVRKSLLEMTKASGYMGMLPEQITDVTSTYAEILRNQGAGRDRTSEQMAAGIINLVKTSETTAHILGQTREEALEAQKLASADYQFQAAAVSQGFDSVTAESVRSIFKSNFGDVGVQAITDQLTFGQVVNKPAAELLTTNPQLQKTLELAETMLKSGASASDVQLAVAESLKANGAAFAGNKAQVQTFAQLSQIDGNSLSGALKANLQNMFVSQSMNTDPAFNRGTDQNQNKEQEAGVGALQITESLYQNLVTIDSGLTMVFNPMINTWGPMMRDEILPAMDAFNKKLQEGAIDVSLWDKTVSTLATTAIAVAGGLALFGGALAIINKGRLLSGAVSAIRGGFRGGGAGAGAGAGGAGGAAAGAGSALKGAAKTLGKAAPVIGGLFEAGEYAFGDKDLTLKNLAKTGLSFGGGALGALGAGMFTGGLGTAAGGIGGYMGGKALGDYLLGPDDLKSNRPMSNTGTPQSARVGSTVPQSNPRMSTADATGQKTKTALSADQMTTKIMEASERSVGLLKQLKDNSDRHLEATREEIAVIRNMSDRMDRLLQEGNKNTKSIAEHSI